MKALSLFNIRFIGRDSSPQSHLKSHLLSHQKLPLLFTIALLCLTLAAGCKTGDGNNDDDTNNSVAGTSEGAIESVNSEAKSLFERLGGLSAVEAVSHELLERVHNDERLGKFFVGRNLERSQRLLTQYLCLITGGGCRYVGRDMSTTHEGLKISGEDFDVFVEIIVGTLNDFTVPQAEQNEFLGLLSPLKGRIINR